MRKKKFSISLIKLNDSWNVFESTGEEDENDEVTRVVLFELLGKK